MGLADEFRDLELTAGALLEMLAALPPERLSDRVQLEGCDCIGWLGEINQKDGYVELRRTDRIYRIEDWAESPEHPGEQIPVFEYIGDRSDPCQP